MNYKVFTSESVAAGHPDKICDQISDAVLDEAIKIYPKSRVAVETLVTKNRAVLAGEITCPQKLDFARIAKKVIKNLGYTKREYGFWYGSPIKIFIHQQSPDIALGVDSGGAGDQGMMFGYATNETPELMPLPIVLAHQLVMRIDKTRKFKKIPYLKPDGKSEVKVIYERGMPKEVAQVVLAVPHRETIQPEQLKEDLFKIVVKPALRKYGFGLKKEDLIVNGTGRWLVGGPASDTGVTGRKIMVDSYGGVARQGGGCFSGKDPTKVDRSGAYAARFIAKNIVAAKLASRVEIQLAYVIGKKEPIARGIETFGTNKVSLKKIEEFAWNLLDLSPLSIIKILRLRRPIYQKTAVYGHFGRKIFPWEKIIS
ncbi:MAG: S-adenosylmethionine synthetase [Microgenomates group bacterium LiPW_31]|nr:MAG: S-adenosylmethionine synthetase [Microgenomates group bacterium LiPW_31]